jgi:putative ABC transport system permease protein
MVVGVLEERVGYHGRANQVIIPSDVAVRLNTGGVNTDPTNLMAALSSGSLFAPVADSAGRTYNQVTVDFDPRAAYQPIRDSILALGFDCFSYAEEFEQFRKFAFYFDLMLSVVGLVALITAALGIVNTMVMSIIERRREIGVLKSLGADKSDIKVLFLVESGVIGVLGAVGGIILGWLVTRVVSAIAKAIMIREGVDTIELFALPLWLILLALAFGLAVSVAAGIFPAARAARVDPVEALRQE